MQRSPHLIRTRVRPSTVVDVGGVADLIMPVAGTRDLGAARHLRFIEVRTATPRQINGSMAPVTRLRRQLQGNNSSSLLQAQSTSGATMAATIWRDVIVSMTKNIADPSYFRPRNFGSSLLYVVREMTSRFGNDLNSALNQPALFLNSVRMIQCRCCRRRRRPATALVSASAEARWLLGSRDLASASPRT